MATKKLDTGNSSVILKESTSSNKKTVNPLPKSSSKGSSVPEKNTAPKKNKNQIVIKYNCGFGNTLFIRGNGAGLSWEKGKPLKNIDSETWVWEVEEPCSSCEFKVLLNDEEYELGDNHRLKDSSETCYSPQFG